MYSGMWIMRVSKWGHGLAMCLFRVLCFEIAREPSREQASAGLRKYRNRLPAAFKFDRETANVRRAPGAITPT